MNKRMEKGIEKTGQHINEMNGYVNRIKENIDEYKNEDEKLIGNLIDHLIESHPLFKGKVRTRNEILRGYLEALREMNSALKYRIKGISQYRDSVRNYMQNK